MDNSLDDSDGPITFEDLGLTRSDPTKQTLIGKMRTIGSLTKCEWLFFAISLASLLASFGLVIQRLATLSKTSDDYTFAILVMITTGFCFYYVLRGILQESLYEILVFIATVVILFIYCVANYIVSTDGTIKLVRLIGISVIGPILIILGLWICKGYKEGGNLVYRTVGANSELQSICRTLLQALSFSVFDLQLQVSIIVLVLKNGTKLSEDEKIVLGVGSAIAFIYFLTVFISMKYEVRFGIYIFWLLSVFEPGYIIYKVYAVHKSKQYSSLLRDCFYGAAIIALVIRLLFIVNSIFVYRNFGKGLKERVYGIEEERRRTISSEDVAPTSAGNTPTKDNVNNPV
ncbi:hypothetical protein GQR58_014071 [Nymphon striatum]|nr:hypothetical protein GQR58_014071 [Nymphon striatum]